MNDQELREVISEGKIDNRVCEFYEVARKQTGKKRLCPTVYRHAWRIYVESVKDMRMET